MDMASFAQRLLSYREQNSLSQVGLGKLLGINPAIISRWEAGRDPQPGLKSLEKIARLLNVTIDALLGDETLVFQRRQTYDLLSNLANTSFWADVLRNIPPDAAIYGYLVVSGFPKPQAREIACPDLTRTQEDLDRDSAPVIARAMLSGGVSRFWMTQVCREIADNRKNKVGERLNAVRLAAELSGFLPIAAEDARPRTGDFYASRTSIIDRDGQSAIVESIRTRLSGLSEGGGLLQMPRIEPPVVVDDTDGSQDTDGVIDTGGVIDLGKYTRPS